MVVYHEQMKFFFTVFFMDCRKQHTAGVDAHHIPRGQVHDSDHRLADEVFRFIEGMNAGKDDAVFAGSIVQCELKKFLALLDCCAVFDLHCAEVRFAESFKINRIFK